MTWSLKSKGLLSCNWWNPKQLGTLTTGISIFLSAGLNMAQGLGWPLLVPSEHFRYSWFIGVIIGTILSLPVRHFVPEKFIMAGSSILILVDGILFTSDPHNDDALLAARYLNGIAVGLATVTYLIHASEIALTSQRGVYLAIEQIAVTVGIAIQMIYTSQWSSDTTTFSPNCLHGIFDIIFGVVAGTAIWLFIESPMDFLRWGDDAAASDCLNRLQKSQGWKLPINVIFVDLKDYVREQDDFSWLESLQRGVLPLAKMILFRSVLLAFSYSLPLNTVLQFSTLVNFITWPPVVAACLRIFGCFLALLLVDNIGRKLPSLFCAFAFGALILGVGIVCNGVGSFASSQQMSVVASLCLMTQFFAGFFAPFTSAYVGEAFPLRVKPYLIATCVIVEQVIQIIVICCQGETLGAIVFLVEGIIVLIISAGLCVAMPETRKTSLREAQLRFRRLLDLKMF